ncbi:MAG TPA: glycoside hydrolase family 3 N-terminal domain-containing protein [Thermohalobaculum sp.]|nr:glycoside hydrolase family 3 N-terminal domain-containing protein [Thermohalobaculum sp.]
MSAPRAAILGLGGPVLTATERDFFADADPWGFILFARNVRDPGQVRRLVGSLRETVRRAAPVLIDQEGGRVARLGPPHWRRWGPVLRLFDGCEPGGDEAAALEAVRLRYRIIAAELAALGIDVDCAPLLDVLAPEGHAIIGDRALGHDAEAVARRGRAVCEGLRAGGVLPVIKHLPGHGRAPADSHERLPRVSAPRAALEAVDFAAFRPLAGEALGMTAHVVFEAIDPGWCATLSPDVIGVIRREIGFDGLLMTDDLSMRALRGPMAGRACAALTAGCDVVLHCNGDITEMREVAAVAPLLAGEAARRAARAEAERDGGEEIDLAAAAARYGELTGESAHA